VVADHDERAAARHLLHAGQLGAEVAAQRREGRHRPPSDEIRIATRRERISAAIEVELPRQLHRARPW
jgi:hypothetical protein